MAMYRGIRDRIAPQAISSQFRYRDALAEQLKKRPRWLDLGCGHQILPDWARLPEGLLQNLPRIVGVDGDLPALRQNTSLQHRVGSDIESLPFCAASFDLVSANMVMEHVLHPEQVLREVRRILSPGGVFLFHTPNRSSPLICLAAQVPQTTKNRLISFFEERREEDVYPTVYRINTLPAVRRLAGEAGFRVERCDLVLSEAVTQVFGPAAIPELLYIRMTQWNALAHLRPDIIAILRAGA